MAARVTTVNNVSIYDLSAGKVQPAWLPPLKKKALKKSGDFSRRVDLIQDFGFPEAARTISISPDGRYIIATGVYSPRVRVWDTAELSLKFERYMDAAPVAHAVISSDYAKLAFLQEDRGIELHAAYGRHYRTRVPDAGRDLAWHAPSAELIVAVSAPFLHRLSLEEGRFLAPLELSAGAANRVAISTTTALIAAACEGGTVEIFDPRSRPRAGLLNVLGDRGGSCDALAVAFEEGGLGLAVGTSDARALIYDLRSARPIATRDHPYGLPVTQVAFHRSSARLVLSGDAKQVKVWRRDDGVAFTNIEQSAKLNGFAVASESPGNVGTTDSGLFFFARDTDRVGIAYVPALGPAPRWASFIDALTEEVDGYADAAGAGSAPGSVYDDYKFLSRDELATLGLEGLVGTNLVKAYLHGFFIDARLHRRVMSVAPTVAAEQLRADKVAAVVAATRAPRVSVTTGVPTVNAALAARLEEEEAERADARADGRAAPRAKAAKGRRNRADDDEEAADTAARQSMAGTGGVLPPPVPSILTDPRFSSLFSDPSYAIDEDEAQILSGQRGAGGAGNGTRAVKAGGGRGR